MRISVSMEVEGILYETLRPLSAAGTTTTATDDIPPSLSSSDEHEPYVVFRNQISLSNLQCPSPETAAPDYFSLDLDGDASDLNNGSVSTPVPAATPLRDKEVERGLEGNWFRANCRFKSPMLQLHQGKAMSFWFSLFFMMIYDILLVRSSATKFALNLLRRIRCSIF